MRTFQRRLTRLQGFLLLLLLPTLTWAVLVSAAQVAQAVRNSPNASAALKQYADAVGKLAINVESGGETTIYNGSCCYGVLQMTETNINAALHISAAQYQQLSLQDQVNAWSSVMSDALNSTAVKSLINLGTFDGRTVDGAMVLSCVQLGQGNCQRMINSGSCSGFADSNGTTICAMADKINNGSSSSGSGSGGTSGGSGSSGGGSTGYSPPPTADCIRQNGACLPVNEAMAQAFESGAGFSMSGLKKTIQGLTAGSILLLVLWIIKDTWKLYYSGKIAQYVLLEVVIRLGVCVSIVALLMSYT